MDIYNDDTFPVYQQWISLAQANGKGIYIEETGRAEISARPAARDAVQRQRLPDGVAGQHRGDRRGQCGFRAAGCKLAAGHGEFRFGKRPGGPHDVRNGAVLCIGDHGSRYGRGPRAMCPR